MFLLDTNIVSELRRPKPHGGVIAWLRTVEDANLYLSAVTLGEIQTGIEITRATAPIRAQEIEAWADQLADSYGILSMDARAFRLSAKLMHGRSRALTEDAMIAASAIIHRMTVVTRNVRDFLPFGVPSLNPFEFAEGRP